MTAGARVLLVSGTDRRELPMFPISVRFSPSKKWALHATKDNYCDYDQAVDFSDGVTRKEYVIELHPGCAHGSKGHP